MKGNSLRPRLVLLAHARRRLYLTRKTLKMPCGGSNGNSSNDSDYQTNNSNGCKFNNSNLFFDLRRV